MKRDTKLSKGSEIHFGSFGPFALDGKRDSAGAYNFEQFWKNVEAKNSGLSNARGVYIAVLLEEESGRLSPIYVGKTSTTFQSRFTEDHHLFKLIRNRPTCSLQVFFLAKMASESGRFKKPKRKVKSEREPKVEGVQNSYKAVRLNSTARLEFMLIGRCVEAGYKLENTHFKVFHEKLKVAGLHKTRAGDKDSRKRIEAIFKDQKS